MKKVLLFVAFCILLSTNQAKADIVDAAVGTTSLGSLLMQGVSTKYTIEYNKALTRNLDAQTENIRKGQGSLQVIRQPDGTAKVYQNGVEIKTDADPKSPEYKMGLKMAESIANRLEYNNAKKELKKKKQLAKIENDTETLEIIKKYKKAGAVITMQKINEKNKGL